MAIRRCPYCKAIIDEQAKYCDNCGTQLLFPEDEFVEEDIPGDKIIAEEEESEETQKEEEVLEEEDEEKNEAKKEEEGGGGGGEEEETDELKKLAESEKEEEEGEEEKLEVFSEGKGEIEEPLEEEQEEESEERIPTGEVIEEEEAEKEDSELRAWMELKEEIAKKAQGEKQKTQPQEVLETAKEKAAAEKIIEKEEKKEIQETDKKYEVSIEKDELVFKTKDLDNLTQAVEEGKKGLEEFLAAFEEKREEKDKKEEEMTSETKDELPPWASGMKEAPLAVTPGQEGEVREEQSPTGQEWATDSGIGIPEKVTQATIPFTDTVVREEEQAEPGVEEAEARPAAVFSLKLKAKVVDLIFVTALWLISLGFTAGVIGVSFFKIIFGSPLPVFAFYLILLLLYFFLFLYFLGETLGDHYFSEED